MRKASRTRCYVQMMTYTLYDDYYIMSDDCTQWRFEYNICTYIMLDNFYLHYELGGGEGC